LKYVIEERRITSRLSDDVRIQNPVLKYIDLVDVGSSYQLRAFGADIPDFQREFGGKFSL
jgi:hypothetical protein